MNTKIKRIICKLVFTKYKYQIWAAHKQQTSLKTCKKSKYNLTKFFKNKKAKVK